MYKAGTGIASLSTSSNFATVCHDINSAVKTFNFSES